MTQHSVLTQHNRAVIIEAYIFSIKIPFYSCVFVENQKKGNTSVKLYRLHFWDIESNPNIMQTSKCFESDWPPNPLVENSLVRHITKPNHITSEILNFEAMEWGMTQH